MRKFGLTILLYFLRSLVYIKRFFAWFVRLLGDIFNVAGKAFRNTIGFRLYKWYLLARRIFGRAKIPFRKRLFHIVSRRSTLQTVLFVVCLVVMIPHSKIHGRDLTSIPGQESLLFALVGPTDEIESFDEVSVDIESIAQNTNAPAWREGAVSTISPSAVGDEKPKEAQELSGISAGGSALTKPTIITGATVPTDDGEVQTTGRLETVTYVVKEGDVIGKIAQKFGISVETLLWANDLSTRSYIRPGDELKILPVTGVIHTVKRGETVGKIARIYDATQNDIIKFNKLQEGGSDIVIGEELVIPDGRKPRPIVRRPPTVRPNPVSSISAPPPSASAPAGSGYIWPTSVRTLTQYFGWRHTGLDIAGPVGSPLYAARAGTVIKAQGGYNGGYGMMVIVDHGGGVKTLYAHASKLYVSVGQKVSQGQTIAAMGSTGRSTGPHIHFEVRVNNRPQNPLRYIR